MDMNEVYERVYGRDKAAEEDCLCAYCAEQRWMATEVKSAFQSPESHNTASWVSLTKVTLNVHETIMAQIASDNRPTASLDRFSCRMAYFSFVVVALLGHPSSVAPVNNTTRRLAIVVRDKWYEALDVLNDKSHFLARCPCLVRDYLLFEQRLTSWFASFAHACGHEPDFVDPVNRRTREFEALVETSM